LAPFTQAVAAAVEILVVLVALEVVELALLAVTLLLAAQILVVAVAAVNQVAQPLAAQELSSSATLALNAELAERLFLQVATPITPSPLAAHTLLKRKRT
jgi:hypothetical protein